MKTLSKPKKKKRVVKSGPQCIDRAAMGAGVVCGFRREGEECSHCENVVEPRLVRLSDGSKILILPKP